MQRLHPTAILAVTLRGERTIITAHSMRHDATLRAMRQIHAARLQALTFEHRESGQDKQETPGVVAPKASNRSQPVDAGSEGRCAQSDTRGP